MTFLHVLWRLSLARTPISWSMRLVRDVGTRREASERPESAERLTTKNGIHGCANT